MIAANHSPWADRLFYPYLKWLLRRNFHTLQLIGETPALDPDVASLADSRRGGEGEPRA